MKRSKLLTFSVFLLTLVFSLSALTASGHTLKRPTTVKKKAHSRPKKAASQPAKPKVSPSKVLPVVGSVENLKTLLTKAENLRIAQYNLNPSIKARETLLASTGQDASGVSGISGVPQNAKAALDYSATNVQVQGVDEADIVKTDGKYIYQVNNRQVIVAEVYSADKLRIVNRIKFDDEQFTPSELYVDNKHLVVIGNTYHTIPGPLTSSPAPQKPQVAARPGIYPPIQVENTVKAIIYDNNDKTKLKKLRDVELEGNYISSRKIGSSLYFIANKYINYYFTPAFRDSAGKNKFIPVGYQDIRYFPDCVEPNYLMIAGINLDLPNQEMKLSTYLGSGQNIYASQDNLYVTIAQYKPAVKTQAPAKLPGNQGIGIKALPFQVSTTIYRFALEQGQASYKSKGEVPGTVLNQFSMDEHKGYFRIATTSGETWRNDEYTSKNNVFVLDGSLNLSGKLENIAPGERIYSVRYMGDRAYMVTFKQVDPLFVIDLLNPKLPKVLGALKIPGYSDYLHPYDANHIIGFGKETVELPLKNDPENAEQTVAYYQGMKIAVFDVTDVKHPVEKFKEIIGDRGTYSELLQNHKALLFAKDKNLLAFPVTVMEIKNKQVDPNGFPQYGEFAFQGAYVYNIDLVNGFKLKGKITHLTDQDLEKSGQSWYDSNKNVERILYIGDTLYTLSKEMIKANELSDLTETGSLSLSE